MDVITRIISLIGVMQNRIGENKEIDQDEKKNKRLIDFAVMVKRAKYFPNDGQHII